MHVSVGVDVSVVNSKSVSVGLRHRSGLRGEGGDRKVGYEMPCRGARIEMR